MTVPVIIIRAIAALPAIILPLAANTARAVIIIRAATWSRLSH